MLCIHTISVECNVCNIVFINLSLICIYLCICLKSSLHFFQARSTGSLCWANDYSYRGFRSGSTLERVSLTVTPFLEDDSEDERENAVLTWKSSKSISDNWMCEFLSCKKVMQKFYLALKQVLIVPVMMTSS